MNFTFFERLVMELIAYPPVSKILRFLYSLPMSAVFIPMYCRIFNCDFLEAELPIWAYTSLRHFFCRRINMQLRPINTDSSSYVSPVDGRIIALGQITKGQLWQIKGQTYSLAQLLEDTTTAQSYEGGSFLTIYMSPGNYHRVHCPGQSQLTGVKVIKGKRYPVNSYSRLRINNLYPRNARSVLHFGLEQKFSVVLVGSCQVGSVKLEFDQQDAAKLRPVLKGEEIGHFDFGSTVVLLWPKGQVGFREDLLINQNIQIGQVVAKVLL